MAFPTTLPSYTITAGAETLNGASGGVGLSGLLNAFEVDITALGTKLGTGASTPVNLAFLVGNAIGTSVWSTNPSGFSLTNAILITPSVTTSINDSNANEAIRITATGSAVNDITVTNAATGVAPQINATGDDTNTNLRLAGKGTGRVYADLHPPLLYSQEGFFDFVASGGVWTGNNYGVNLNASMTAMVCYINGRRISIGAVTSRAFTTNVDTYIDVLDNIDGTGTLVYTTAATNAASPSLAANSMRIGIIQAGATIAAVGAVNQGQQDKLLPIASSIPYQVTDSLGNLICPCDSTRKLIGYRRITGGFSTASGVAVQITALSVPAIVPTSLRKVKASMFVTYLNSSGGASNNSIYIVDGVVGVGSAVLTSTFQNNGAGQGATQTPFEIISPASGLHTYNGAASSAASTLVIPSVASIMIELE